MTSRNFDKIVLDANSDILAPQDFQSSSFIRKKSNSSISFFESLRQFDQKELQERLNATTQITSNTVSNLCINFLANQPLTPNDVLLSSLKVFFIYLRILMKNLINNGVKFCK